ncbi:MAG: ROK family protein [Actinomycetota bacterium]|nr:ROK family protein [Actinomycetota bacterium]
MAGGCVIGVDLGGTKLLAGAVEANLDVHHRAYRLAPASDLRAVIDAVASVVEEARAAVGGEVRAIGFGIPSLFDHERAVAVSTVHLPIRDVRFRDIMAERLGLPVFVDNDANVAMLAEHRFGAARGAKHALLLTLGTGVGGAIVVDGALVRGTLGSAGELGHMVIDVDGPRCQGNCPGRGCLEAFVSGTALGRDALRAAHEHPDSGLGRALAEGRAVTGALVTELAHDGDPTAGAVMRRVGEYLGVGIASLVNIFNPSVVVVGGGVIAAGELLLEPAREVLARRALSPSRETARIVPARFGAESGMLGAAILARDGAGDAEPTGR